MPTTFFLEPRPYVFFAEERFGRKQRIYVEQRGGSFPSFPDSGFSVNDSRHFRHFPLDYLPGAWYNKVVIPQTLHQQHREKAEIMLNTKTRRSIVFVVVAVSLAVFVFPCFGESEKAEDESCHLFG